MASPFSNPPVVLLVPGAFSRATYFDKIVSILETAGFSTRPASFPSFGTSEPLAATCQADVDSLRTEFLLPILDEHKKDVVLLAHSYGAIVASGAAKNLDKISRQKEGKQNGVIGLIFVAGNLVLEGESLAGGIGGVFPPFMKVDYPSDGFLTVGSPIDIVFHDCDPVVGEQASKEVGPHAYHAFMTEAPAPAWASPNFDGRRAYFRTLDDRCNPLPLQDMWLAKSGVSWETVDMKTGHIPFVSQPEKLGGYVVKFIKNFITD